VENSTVRDMPKQTIYLATLTAVAICIALGGGQHPMWFGFAAAVFLTGIAMAPKFPPGHPERWDIPDQLFQAVGMSGVAVGGTLAFVLAWWWALVGAGVMVACTILANEWDKRASDGGPA
jgi:hypothetical protein